MRKPSRMLQDGQFGLVVKDLITKMNCDDPQ